VPVTNLGIGSLSHWTAATSLSELTVTTIGGGQPTDGIIGAPGSNNDYSNANGSLTGGTKQPYADQTAVFTLDLTGTNITLDSITGVEIGFGTQGNNYIGTTAQITVQGFNSSTPEPETFWLFGLSAVLIGLRSRAKAPDKGV